MSNRERPSIPRRCLCGKDEAGLDILLALTDGGGSRKCPAHLRKFGAAFKEHLTGRRRSPIFRPIPGRLGSARAEFFAGHPAFGVIAWMSSSSNRLLRP